MEREADELMKLAEQVADVAAVHADRHDRDGSFVVEGVEEARRIGYLAAPVPEELGGRGCRTRAVAEAQRVIARACGSTALACSMHLHVVLAAAWRWRRGDDVVESTLRRVLDDGIVVVSTGGNDWTHPTSVATPTDGGWRVNGRKTFASSSPVGDVAATFAVVGEAEPGAEVIAFGCPMDAPGLQVQETWDSVGMRGTGSHDIILEDVFVADGQVNGRRRWGELDRPLLLAALHAWPVVYATYLGVAEGLVGTVLGSRQPHERDARAVGALDVDLRSARWALAGAFEDLGPDPEPTLENFVTLQQMKYLITSTCGDIAAGAREVAGGAAYARRGAVDRMIRDLGAAMYHPYPPERALSLAGRFALGLDEVLA